MFRFEIQAFENFSKSKLFQRFYTHNLKALTAKIIVWKYWKTLQYFKATISLKKITLKNFLFSMMKTLDTKDDEKTEKERLNIEESFKKKKFKTRSVDSIKSHLALLQRLSTAVLIKLRV